MATEKKIIDVKLIGLEDAVRNLAALNTLFKEQDATLKNLKKAKEQDAVAIAAQTIELQKTKKAIKDLTNEVVNEVKIREKRAAQIDKQVEKEYNDLLKIDAANQKAALKKQQLDEKELNSLIKKEAADSKAAAKAEEKYQREIAALIKKEEAAKTADEKEQLRYAKLIMQVENEDRKRQAMLESRSQKEQIAVTKAGQRATKETAVLAAKTAKETGYLNQLRMAVDNLEKEYYQLSEAEYKNATNKVVGSKGKQVLDDLTKQRAALQTAQAEYGKYSMNVGNYASATNMLAINLGQVMKEAPNFAISARIGIMSLTNNLPMLAEAIKAVKVQQADLNDQFKKGLIDKKPDSLFKMITASVFGLTGVMSLLMVAFQLWGDDLLKAIGSMFKGEEAVKRLTNAELGLNTVTENLHETMKSGGGTYGETIKSIEGLKVKLEAAKGSTELSKAAVEEYNTTLGETFGKATSVDEALGKITANEKDYIEAMKNMAYANEFFSISAKDAVKAMGINTAKNSEILGDNAKKYIDDINKAKQAIADAKDNSTSISEALTVQYAESNDKLLQRLKDAESAYNQAAKAERERQIQEISNNQKISLAKATEYYNKYADLAKKNGWDLTKEEKEKNDKQQERIMREFDYETKIMEAQQKQIQDNRESELKAIEVSNTKKLNASKNYIEDLEKLAGQGNKDAKGRLPQAKIDAAKYEVELEKEKNFEKLKVNAKYDEIVTQNQLENLKHTLDMTKVSNELQKDEEQKYLDEVYALNVSSINRELISEELKNQKLLKLKNDYLLNSEALTEKYRKINAKAMIDELQTQIDAITANKDIRNQDIDEEFNLKQAKREREATEAKRDFKTKEEEAAYMNKFKLESDLADQEREIKKIEQKKAWADEALAIARGVADFMGALGQRELADYEKKNKGKVGFEEAFAKKKTEIAIRDAILQRSLSSFETVINTAAMIMKLGAQGGVFAIPLQVSAGILGAAQLATIWAAPLPSYEASGSGSSGNTTKTTVTEKFHTGGTAGGSANSVDKSQEVTATLLKGEQILTKQQTGVFNNILGSIKSMGGSGSITSGVGVNAINQTDMLKMAMQQAFQSMPPPQVEWVQFKKFEDKMATFEQNRLL